MMKEITLQELVEEFDESVRPAIKTLAEKAHYLVVCENIQLDSSACGEKSCLGVGPGFTYESLEELEGKHLNSLPSQRQYPVRYVVSVTAEES